MQYDSALEAILTVFLNVEATDLEAASVWARRDDLPEPSLAQRDAFKTELERALQQPYTVSPQLFERWTHEDRDNQEEVQQRLQELWDACFGPLKD